MGVDAHAHVFLRDMKLADGRRYDPVADAPLSAYLRLLDELGMARGVLVQPSFLGFDNGFLLKCIARAEGRLRGVAVVAEDISAPALTTLTAGGVAGIRFNLIGGSIPNFYSPTWRGHLRRIADAGLHIEVQCRGHEVGEVLTPLLDNSTRVVLDHFGLPASHNPADPSVRQILSFGAVGQVLVKISAPYRFLPAGTDPRPLLAAYLHAFGPTNLLWGSDWPHTQFEDRGNALDSLARLGQILGKESHEYAAVTSWTAQELYHFLPVHETDPEIASDRMRAAPTESGT
jgi:predicted TIM-barrel fold metal-dependent hydrolase